MKLIRRREKFDDGDAVTPAGDGSSGGRTVVVGVKIDSRSRELLTWALVKIAEPGDLVVALHVLDAKDIISLPSLVMSFDSVFADYEGFLNLKQVNLKFEVRRGSSVRKLLVEEAKLFGKTTSLLVGTSRANYTFRSSASVVSYCARKLPKCISVFAVDNGKVIFHREANNHQGKIHEGQTFSQNSISSAFTKKNMKNCLSCARLVKRLGSPDEHEEEISKRLRPIQKTDDVSSNSSVAQESNHSKFGCSLLLPKKYLNKSFVRNACDFKRAFRKPNGHSSRYVHLDHKQSNIKHNGDPVPKDLLGLQEKYSSSCTIYSFQELASATSNFTPENLIGQGGSSLVYRGCLPDGKELAVKILKPSQDALKEFVLEIETMTSLHHKNIISLSGFCFEGNNLLLAYNFLSRGSLEENLHGNKKDLNAFGWEKRYKVAVGIAEVLDYLHNGSAEAMIHRDVKSANILLSDDFDPQLSDFGLAACLNSSSHVICTDVVGTFGYIAPEYFMYGRMTDKIDVYAFGVVLLELLSSRKPINNDCPKDQQSLIMWADTILKSGKVSQLLDPSLASNYDGSQIERMVLAATLCIREDPRVRPQINHILKLLWGDEEVIRWAKQEVSAPEEHDVLDGEPVGANNNIQSFINLALLDAEEDDDSASISSPLQSVSVEDYLRGRSLTFNSQFYRANYKLEPNI